MYENWELDSGDVNDANVSMAETCIFEVQRGSAMPSSLPRRRYCTSSIRLSTSKSSFITSSATYHLPPLNEQQSREKADPAI